jgi:hypothetical protein
MTLPSRLVSILLVYCFVVASAAPQTRAQTAPRELTVTGNQTNGFFDRTYNFFSTLFARPLDSPEEESSMPRNFRTAPRRQFSIDCRRSKPT